MRYVVLGLLLLPPGCDLGRSTQDNTEDQKQPQDTLQVVWQQNYQVAEAGPSTPPKFVKAKKDSVVLFAGEARLNALDFEDGSIKWFTELNPRRELDCVGLVVDDSWIYGSHLYKAVSWGLQNGEKRWEYSSTERGSYKRFYSLGRYDVGPDYFYGGADGGWFLAVDKKTGQLAYERQFEFLPRGLTYKDGRVYFGQAWTPEGAEGQSRGALVKVEAATADTLWRFRTKRGGFYDMSPFVKDGRVYAGTRGGENTEFVALDAETGDVLWRNRRVRVHWAIWAETPNGSRIFVNNGRNVLALDPKNGSVLWRTDMQAGHGEGGLAYLDGHVYHPHGQGLRVINAKTGEVVHIEWPENGYFWEVGTGAGKVFAQDSGALYAFEPYSPK
jgi:outer membrane protein assembly factor BamB